MSRTDTTVTAKRRKRCPGCRRMIEQGETAVLTDDRYSARSHSPYLTMTLRTFPRGAWHLWHPDCAKAATWHPNAQRATRGAA